MDFVSMMNEYIRTELLIVTPVLYIIARMLENSKINNDRIPWVLLVISLILAGLYTFANTDVSTFPGFLMALFSTLVQGVLLSGTAVFGGILGKLVANKKSNQS